MAVFGFFWYNERKEAASGKGGTTVEKVILGAFADEAGGSLAEQTAALRDHGMVNLEARNIEGRNFVDLAPDEAREMKARLDEAGLRVWSIGSPIGKIGADEPFAPHLDRLRRALELGRIMGSERMRVFSFYIPAGESHAVCRDEVGERLERMLEAADGSGIRLCHENEKGIYGDTAAHCAELLKALPALWAVFDPANFVQCGEDTLTAWERLHERVDYFHVKDCLADGRVVPCGAGDGHLPELIRAFCAAGGRQLTLEPHLAVFDGFGALERAGEQSRIDDAVYPSPRAAFDAAADALRSCLETMS